MVDDPEKFQRELRALDVPAGEVRHPVVYGKLGRSRPLAVHELQFAQSCASRPVKVALPGPYLLTRTMWLDCLTERPYETRDDLARDIVRVLREETHYLLAAGAALVQFDEPVLTEVVHGGAARRRSFMCGALSEKLEPGPELDFAVGLTNEVVRGLPAERLALHVCRGNWTRDESAALSGDYQPLMDALGTSQSGSPCSSSSARRGPAKRTCCAVCPTTGASASASSTRSSTRWSAWRRYAGESPARSAFSVKSVSCSRRTAVSQHSPTTLSRPRKRPKPS